MEKIILIKNKNQPKHCNFEDINRNIQGKLLCVNWRLCPFKDDAFRAIVVNIFGKLSIGF